MYLHYATVIGDSERVIEHWVMEEEWSKAIDTLNRQVRCSSISLRGFVLIPSHPVKSRTVLQIWRCTFAASSKGDGRLMVEATYFGSNTPHTVAVAASTCSSRPSFTEPSHSVSEPYCVRTTKYLPNHS